jgi:hypothetical protein
MVAIALYLIVRVLAVLMAAVQVLVEAFTIGVVLLTTIIVNLFVLQEDLMVLYA